MSIKPAKALMILSVFSLLSLSFFGVLKTRVAYSAGSQPVISEIQTRGDGGANDEFVELYNPSDNPVDLTGWSLARMAAGSDSESNFVTPIAEGVIPARGYFLIARSSASTPGYNGATGPDLTYGLSLADNTTILLYDNSDPKQLIDKVGLGENTSPEGSPAPQLVEEDPPADRSIERVGEDTDDNSVDFTLQQNPNPQTSSTSPTPTDVPTPFPTEELTPTPTDELTPTPTETLTPTPTEAVSPTPTEEPEVSPTEEPTPTLSPTPTIQPTPTPPALPTPKVLAQFVFPRRTVTCLMTYKVMSFRFFSIVFPFVVCN